MKPLLLVLVLLVAGCQTTAVLLKHPTTGKVIQCGPFSKAGNVGELAAAQHESQCIQDFKEQGYLRWQK